MGFFEEFFTIIIRGLIFEFTGAFIRKTWFKVTGTKSYNTKSKSKQWGFEPLIDMESFKDKVVGFLFLFSLVVAAVVLF